MQVLLIEDDAAIAEELRLHWLRRGWEVRVAGSLRQADNSREVFSGVIVLDLGLPDGDGLQWLARLRLEDAAIPVLVLTARDRIADRVKGLQGGADDYLIKPFSREELDARIEVLARRANLERGPSAHYGSVTWLRTEGRASAGGRAMELSPREFEVLGMLVVRAPRLVSKRMLVDTLAERNGDLGDAAAEVYISRLRRKLAGSGTAIRTLRGFGYHLAIEDPGSVGQGAAAET